MDVIESVNEFYKNFDGEKGYIGVSEGGALIPYMKRGSGKPVLIVTAAIHAREYITSYVLLKMIKNFDKGIEGSVYFIPLLNPDGVKISLYKKPLYKANLNGVDLNTNFDARWGTGVKNVRYKGDENYIGEFPFSEKETRALRDFTLKISPDMTVSYHAKGEEIYYEFYQSEKDLKRDFLLAKAAARSTGYKIRTPYGSAGGYKDWCIEKLKIPALTIEVGSDRLSHPIKKEFADEIFEKNKNIIKVLTERLKKQADEKDK